jgi:hypothetical protein
MVQFDVQYVATRSLNRHLWLIDQHVPVVLLGR